MHVLLATDAQRIVEAVVAALGDDETYFTVCTEGRRVSKLVQERAEDPDAADFDLAVLDLQIGSMGGMAVTMSLRLDESSGRLPHVPVLMLLDRTADEHLARRSGAEGWLVKPLDPLRLGRAARAVVDGRPYHNGPARPVVDTSSSTTADTIDEVGQPQPAAEDSAAQASPIG